ncbi:ankyrin repeat protein [Anaeramoeba ignava]|uniref:Ankyrin repeat protein n=1 Tax=Anaeramoeba ignava TaxID=1746090 RepID=A0A9Q0LKL3_ANAIG|nr:ankyrin repeat protein [Anaeramoeba ignava]
MFQKILDQEEKKVLDLLSNIGNIGKTEKEREQLMIYESKKYGRYKVIEKLISEKISVNCFDYLSKTPLHYISSNHNNTKIIEMLIREGAKVDALDKSHKTPLHYACQNHNSKEVIFLLVDLGSSVNLTDSNGMNSLHYECCSQFSRMEVIKYLINKGVDINSKDHFSRTSLNYLLLERTKPEIIKEFCNLGQIDFQSKDHLGQSFLHYVCYYPNQADLDKLFRLFVESYSVDPNSQDFDLKSPLHLLILNSSSLPLIEYAVSKGADVNSLTNDNKTPLHVAFERGSSFALFEFLLQKGAKIHHKPKKSSSALALAMINKMEINVIRLLLQHSENPNCKIYEKSQVKTPLEISIEKSDVDLFKLLLHYGAKTKLDQIKDLSPEFQNWAKVYSSLMEDFLNLFSRQELTDFEVKCKNGKSIGFHKLFFRLRTSDSIDLFLDENNPFHSKIISNFQGFALASSQEDVELFLKFVYSGICLPSKEKEVKEMSKKIGLAKNWFRKKDHRRGLLFDLEKLYQHEESKDFAIIVFGKEIKVHKIVLLARSELFRGMFLSVTEDQSNKVNDYSERSFEAMKELIYFLYFDSLSKDCSFEVSEELKDAVDFYQLNLNSNLNQN